MRRILITDDECHLLQVFGQALVCPRPMVESICNGDALRKAHEWQPEVLMADARMPRMAGEGSRTTGNLNFVAKPFSIRRLASALEDFLGGCHAYGERFA